MKLGQCSGKEGLSFMAVGKTNFRRRPFIVTPTGAKKNEGMCLV